MTDNSFGHVNLKTVRFRVGFSRKKLPIGFAQNYLNSTVPMPNTPESTRTALETSRFFSLPKVSTEKKRDANHDYYEI